MTAAAAGTNLLLAGLPRSGNGLALTLLNRLDDVVVIDEGLRQVELQWCRTPDDLATATRRFLAEQRRLARAEGQVWTHQRGGVVVSDAFTGPAGAAGRQASVSQGWIDIGKPVSPDFTLVVKQPVAFSGALGTMAQRWPVGAIVRNPLEALVSWNRVTFALSDGRSALIEEFHPALSRQLQALPDRIDRQIRLLHWWFGEIVAYLPPGRVVRYEEIAASRGAALGRILPAAADLDVAIAPRHHADAPHLLLDLGERLLRSDGAAWNVYARSDVEAVIEAAASGGMTPVRAAAAAEPLRRACG